MGTIMNQLGYHFVENERKQTHMNFARALLPNPSFYARAAVCGGRSARCGSLARCSLLLLGMSLLLSCAGTPPAPVADRSPAPDPEQSFAGGDFSRAARLWQQQALSATGPAADALRVKAADAWLLADQPAMAQDNLRWVDKSRLAAPEQARMNLVLADLALRAGRPDEAGSLLQEAAPDLPRSARKRYEQLRANTARMLSAPGAMDLSRTIALARSSSQYQPEQALALLQSLDNVPSGGLALRAENPRGDQILTGWLDLALVIRQNLVEPESLPQAISSWKVRHPQHFLRENEALDLWLRYRQQFAPPRKVAVLLPESGRLQAAAEAIRDGITSAFLDHPGGAELLFFSTGAEGELAASAYFEARDQGAQWIIGPLQKTSIETLLNLAGLVTPVLALNDLPQEFIAPPGLSGRLQGISFSPDEEARDLAREVIRSGFHRAIILTPETEWGERMAQNFSDEFLHEKGQIVASSRYLESENDHSQVLQRLLKIDASKARKQGLENTLQMKLDFEPVRREDVDVIFLAAGVTQGRSIRPQLRFNYAGDIPVYASSKIFSGRPDRTADQDLNGVRFPTTPLQLGADSGNALSALSSLRGGVFTTLYALGKDAWNLLPWLDLMQRDADFRFAGASGYYHIGPGGKLLREPVFAIFSGGRPVPLARATGAMVSP
jgi:hypothetical protein